MLPIIMQKVFSEPWLIMPQAHEAIQQSLLNHMLDPKAFAGLEEKSEEAPKLSAGSGVAYVQLYGVVGKHLSGMEMACGGCSVDQVAADLRAAAADPTIDKILLDVDSPGGTITGVPELAHLIREIKVDKPIYAFTEALMGSAAMWIGSACSGIIATPSSKVGSIGAYLAFEDHTERNEANGSKLLLFEAGKHKAIGLRPPTTEESGMLQDRVEAIHEEFKASILIERPSVIDSTMQGLVYSGIEAESLGLVDAIVMSFDEALKAVS
jgi:signal peptide peptidase SppA